jgi:two-component system chemotaxis sensor kinase CheA
MVGLEAIARFTNGIETVLDKIRGGSLGVDSDIITTLLESRDHLAAMIEGEAAGSSVPGSGELAQRLSDLLPGNVAAPAAPVAPQMPAAPAPPKVPLAPATASPEKEPALVVRAAPEPKGLHDAPRPVAEPPARVRSRSRRAPRKASSPAESKSRGKRPSMGKARPPAGPPAARSGEGDAAGDSGRAIYQISLAPGPDTLRRGVNPLGVLDELRELGECTITTDPQLVPGIDTLDPERCYLSWTVVLRTDAELERLRDVFLFVSEDSTIKVERRLVDGTLEPVPLQAPPEPVAAPRKAPETKATPATPHPEPVPGIAHPSAIAPPIAAGTNGAHAPATAAARPGVPAAGTAAFPAARPHARIRVDALQLDDLVGLAGELVVLSDNLQGLRDAKSIAPWLHALEALERVSREIRDTTLELRMVPVDELFSRFPRVVRDLADRSGKEIDLRIVGQETRLDRTIVERLADPMVHLIRNAVDHALESPAERLEKQKPRVGRITLIAGHEGDRVAIRVEDDGRGLDREKIIRKGVAKGLIPTGTSPDDPRVVSLIFEPGFSTRDDVSDLSGRGVGLDVVRDSVRALRGSLSVESTPGKGTSFIFRLPLTLALIDGLLVETAGGKFVVPLTQVEECVSLNGTTPALAKDRPCVSVRGELVPMISLRTLFRTNGPLPARQELLLTRHSGQRIGVAVDRLVGRVQAVIQSLGEGLHGLTRFSGATILGDGSVSLILDLSAVVSESLVASHHARHPIPSGGVRAESFR